MPNSLPIRLTPHEGESLESYLARLANANGLNLSGFAHPADDANPLQALANMTGQHLSRLVAMTPKSLARAAQGSPRRHQGGWLTDQYRWACPLCTAQTGIMQLDWNLASHPVCMTCHVVLVRTPDRTIVSATEGAEHLAAKLTGWVRMASHSGYYRRQLHELRRLITLVAQTIDSSWPLPDESIPQEVWQQARLWGRHPTPSPRAAVLLLEATNPFARSADDTAALVGEGWRRLDERFGVELPVPPSYLPPRPSPPRQRPNPTWQSRDRERLTQLRAYLQSLATATGLAGHHVPGLLFTSLEYPLPPVEAWPAREKSAFVLHLLLTGDSLGPARVAKSVAVFGLAAAPDAALQYPDGVGRGIGAILARQLKEAAAMLVEEGLVDYQRRRQLFGARVPLPAQLLRRVPTSPNAELLARGWLWIHFARSRLGSSPHPGMSDGQVLAFDSALDAETRLLLHEAGSAWIAATDTLPWATTAPPAAVRQETA